MIQAQQNNIPTIVNCSTLNEILLSTLVLVVFVTRDWPSIFCVWLLRSRFPRPCPLINGLVAGAAAAADCALQETTKALRPSTKA
jgi:hypothetical protein